MWTFGCSAAAALGLVIGKLLSLFLALLAARRMTVTLIQISKRRCLLAAAALCVAAAGMVHAQDFPTRPVQIIGPYAAGASTDTLARMLTASLSKELGQPVVVSNKPGAGGIIAAQETLRAPADGYTILLVSSAMLTVNQSIYSKLPYDPLKDFAPVGISVRMPIALVVNPAQPIKNVQELIAYAKANPGKLTFGSAGTGTTQHLAGELFKSMTGADILHIPYKGGAPAMVDLIGGQISMMFVQAPSALQQIKGGKIRALAVDGVKRDPDLPDVPTADESGVKGYDLNSWYGFVVPAGVPEPALHKLQAAVAKALKENEAKLTEQGYLIDGGSPKDMADAIAAESKKWAVVVKAANIKAD
jgi:tripartite-type tricarboxylate transporter receptor subunit TctC